MALNIVVMAVKEHAMRSHSAGCGPKLMEPETSLARSMFAAVHSDFAGPPRTFAALDAKAIVTRLRKTPRLKFALILVEFY